ncbi:spermidine/putrescine ABC transporter ATP-binding protein [Corynebacterium phocae]|uniref:Spermidine/putrescine ABC transporter ATP-binding protein n=1 Tax=Corynebacterium phocae TaxID=161895 RepID=A0A1L7D6C5_9CORY|nr:spermidine/putrescine ABC transporter ATP-binding protein [Corynebacterium phocae]
MLDVAGLRKTFGTKVAVDDLSFHVNRGETLCLLGPNGAGKTTTIEICEGFMAPDSGQITVLGLDPTRQPDAVRERIGIMLQGGGSYSGIRVREMMALSAAYRKNPLDPQWLLEILGLEGAANNTYRRLSGGQKQRLSLALALIGRPELVFLDEPTAGMDSQSKLVVWDLVAALKRDGVTVVLTTHLMDEAEALADRVAIIDNGAKVAEGSVAELARTLPAGIISFETSAAVDTARMEAAGLHVRAKRPLSYELIPINVSAGTNASLTGALGDGGVPTPETVAALTAELARQNIMVRRIDTASATLEDVFLQLTGRELRA